MTPSRKLHRSKIPSRSSRKRQYRSLQIENLPTEILEKILNNLHVRHRNRVRVSCKRFKNVYDHSLMHQFKSDLIKYKATNDKGYEYSALMAIKQATWAYMKAGYFPLFLNIILPLVRNHKKDPFCRTSEKIKIFLNQFYRMVEKSLKDPIHQKVRLLYVITLLGFLYKYENSKTISSEDLNPTHWRLVFQVKGSWLGMQWNGSNSDTLNYPENSNGLLISLAEIIIYVQSGTPFNKMWNCNSKVLLYGHDLSTSSRAPYTNFIVNIHGSENIITFLKTAPNTELWTSLPNDEFTMNLQIYCGGSNKWACTKDFHLEIGPYCEKSDHDEMVKIKCINLIKKCDDSSSSEYDSD